MLSSHGLARLLALLAATTCVQSSPTPFVKRAAALPDYALRYAPVTYLHSGDSWFPADVAVHLANVIPEVDYAPIDNATAAGSATLATLNSLPANAYLTAKDNVADAPAWLSAAYGKPDSSGYSAAPGTIIAVQKNDTWVDVFYFYFYSYDYGGKVLGINFGNHVGDWEHSMIRFVDGQPYAIYLSEHGAGSAYYWDILNKTADGRPLVFSATGSHANYAKAGKQEYTIALGLVTDQTDAGFAWDMTRNYRGYWYDNATATFSEAAVGANQGDGAAWLQWHGYWGDEKYKTGDSAHPDQYCLVSQCKYTSGPTGPVAKNLGRTAMCQKESSCKIFTDLDDLTKQS